VLRARLQRSREQEVATAIDELVAIAEDRYRNWYDPPGSQSSTSAPAPS
jgi:2-oxo-4-hydroxy-4-carboxy--5-ureidoimidazoline (OHCU) decarboxylase